MAMGRWLKLRQDCVALLDAVRPTGWAHHGWLSEACQERRPDLDCSPGFRELRSVGDDRWSLLEAAK